ncbi:hypothetical protein OAD62_02995 [Oceanihabitans sp.]|nr:hypothetical protein [Oceanihabitans sp.]
MKTIYLSIIFFHFTFLLFGQNEQKGDIIFSQDCESIIYGEVEIQLLLNEKNQLYTKLLDENKQVIETRIFQDEYDKNLDDLISGIVSKTERNPVGLYYNDINSDGKEDLVFEYDFYIGAGPESGKVINRVECFLQKNNRWTWVYQNGSKKTYNWQYAYDRDDISYKTLYSSVTNTGYIPLGYSVSQKNRENLLLKVNERIILSFTTNSDKKVSLAVAEDFNYLSYRFGTPENIELTYKVTEKDSSKFKYSWNWEPSLERWADKEYDMTSLTFQISDYEYTIFQNRVDSISLEDIEYAFGHSDKAYNLELLKQYNAAKELDGVGIMVRRLSTNEKTIMKAKRVDIGGLKDLFYLSVFVEND